MSLKATRRRRRILLCRILFYYTFSGIFYPKKENINHNFKMDYGSIKRIPCPLAGEDKGDVKYEIF